MDKIAGLSSEDIKRGLENCKVTPMRFQKIEKNGIKYINDSYNASPVSMKYSLETLADAYRRNFKNSYYLQIWENLVKMNLNII